MLRLIRNQIGVEPIFEGDHSNSKIIITPDIAKTRCKQGIVKQLGPNVENIKIGDYVLFGAYDGTIVAFDEELMLIIPEDAVDAIAVIDPQIKIHEFDYDGDGLISYVDLMKEVRNQIKDAVFIPIQAKKKK